MARLDHVAGFAPEVGETAAELSGRYPSTLAPTLGPPVLKKDDCCEWRIPCCDD